MCDGVASRSNVEPQGVAGELIGGQAFVETVRTPFPVSAGPRASVVLRWLYGMKTTENNGEGSTVGSRVSMAVISGTI